MSTNEDPLVLHGINTLVESYGLKAEWLEGVRSVGVQGDHRTVTPVIVLIGPFPGHKVLADVSNRISNKFPVNRVTFELAAQTQCLN